LGSSGGAGVLALASFPGEPIKTALAARAASGSL
jgi:hypothetical protein